MATANQLLAKSEAAVALLIFNNTNLSASSVSLANTTGKVAIHFSITISGITVSGVALPGQSISITLPAGTVVFAALKGGFGITGFQNMIIGTG